MINYTNQSLAMAICEERITSGSKCECNCSFCDKDAEPIGVDSDCRQDKSAHRNRC